MYVVHGTYLKLHLKQSKIKLTAVTLSIVLFYFIIISKNTKNKEAKIEIKCDVVYHVVTVAHALYKYPIFLHMILILLLFMSFSHKKGKTLLKPTYKLVVIAVMLYNMHPSF